MRRSDIFVFPTLADTLPLVVLEAMAQGLPVIASSVGGIPYQLDDACGVLVEPGDPAALAAAVQRLAAQPMMLAAMGRRARARVGTHFTWETAAASAMVSDGRLALDDRSCAFRSLVT
ncbi:MAG: glycosyltransferase family 4 protein, partial [Actinomycetota bacterium]